MFSLDEEEKGSSRSLSWKEGRSRENGQDDRGRAKGTGPQGCPGALVQTEGNVFARNGDLRFSMEDLYCTPLARFAMIRKIGSRGTTQRLRPSADKAIIIGSAVYSTRGEGVSIS
jgi:hypothetical protein